MSTRTNIGKVTPIVKGTFDDSVPYERLDMVVSDGVSYIAKQNVPAGTTPPQSTYWMPMLDNADATAAAAAAAINANEAAENAQGATSCVDTVAKPFDVTEDYPAGGYVIRSAKMYEFLTDHSAGNFDSGETLETTAGNEAFELKKGMTSNNKLGNMFWFPKYKDAIVANTNENCANGAVQSDGTYNSSKFRLHSTTKYPIPSIRNFKLLVKNFGLRTDVCLNYWNANNQFLGSTAYAQNNGTITVNTSSSTYATASYFTLQFSANDVCKMDLDWLARNPVVLLRECSDIEKDLEKVLYRGYIEEAMEKGNFVPTEQRYWRVGGTSDVSRTYYREVNINNRLSCLIPFNLKSFDVVWSGPTGAQYFFYLLDSDLNVVGWSYGYDWRNNSYQHDFEGDDLAYLALSYRYSDNRNMSLSDLSNITLEIRPIETASSDTVPFSMRVMSYNVGHWCYGTGSTMDDCGIPAADYNTKSENLKKFWMKYKPDVLSMNEYYKWLDHDKSHLSDEVLFDWLYQYNYRTDNWNALFSNHELLNRSRGYLSESDTRKEYLLAEIHSHGVMIAVFVYHGPTVEEEVQEELTSIVSKLNAYDYAIVCGDFNTDDLDTLTTAGFKKANGGYLAKQNTWNYTNPTIAIDNVLVKGRIKIMNFEVLYDEAENLCSDHVPVIADLDIV